MKNIRSMAIITLIITLLLTFCATTRVMANSDVTKLDIAATAKKVNPTDYKPSDLTQNDYQTAFEKTKTIINIITSVGIVISVVMTIVLGIRYMIGSVEKKAEYKKTMIPMMVGIILLFSVSTIVKTIYAIMKDFNA